MFEFETILHGLRWACGLGADLTQSWTRRKMCIGGDGRGGFDRAFDAELAFEFRPVKAEGGARIGGEIAAFGAGGVAIKTNPWMSACFNSTLLSAGRPLASAVARAMAVGSAGSYLCAWAS